MLNVGKRQVVSSNQRLSCEVNKVDFTVMEIFAPLREAICRLKTGCICIGFQTGRAPFNSEGQFTKLNSRSEKRDGFNKGEAYLTRIAPADGTGVTCRLVLC